MIDPNERPPFFRRLRVPANIIPFILFGVLLAVLGMSTSLSGKRPVIESVAPRIAAPGEILVIRGSAFGHDREDGDISIAGIIPTGSSYLEWTDTRISVRIPEDVGSGLVTVRTGKGESNAVLFANRALIPVVLSGPAKPGVPYIREIDPERGYTGGLITIRGANFGPSRGNGAVYFAWVPSEGGAAIDRVNFSGLTPADEIDFDYDSWSEREIRVRVPSGSVSGNLVVKTERGESNAVFFELLDDAGTRVFLDKVTYSVTYAIDVRSIVAEPKNELYLWVPRVYEGPAQRDVQLVNREPVPQLDNYRGNMLYHFSELASGREYRVVQTFMFDRYSIENRIKPSKVIGYDKEKPLYKAYTAPDMLVPSDDERFVRIARTVVGRERNPYLASRAIYDYVLDRLEYSPLLVDDRDLHKAIQEHRGTAYSYALVFCTLARSSGIPARPVAGFLVDDTLKAIRHVWAEIYLENYGWIPVDPVLGDGVRLMNMTLPDGASEFYFGGLENRHITFSKGITEMNPMDPHGRTVRKDGTFTFQTIHEEAVGNLHGYSSVWHDPVILGIY